MLRGHTGAPWCLFLLAAVTPGVHLQRSDHEVQIYQPVLQPSEAVPKIGTYMVTSVTGKPCIKATMGAEFIITEKKKTWYFNLDPSMVGTSGYCGKEAAGLSLTLPGNTTSLQFTFRKEKKVFYISTLTAHVSPRPVCQRCADKTYSGVLDHNKLFITTDGHSFKCKSENLLLLSSELKVKLVPLQVQAFTLLNGLYGEEEECWADFNKEIVPIIIGAIVVGLVLTAVLSHLFIKDRRRQGYSRI